ncbi:MAG TPA: hypothetical protein VF644_20975 [Pyrinomonadaceae bacterium]
MTISEIPNETLLSFKITLKKMPDIIKKTAINKPNPNWLRTKFLKFSIELSFFDNFAFCAVVNCSKSDSAMTPRYIPHERQNFCSVELFVAQFGQNINSPFQRSDFSASVLFIILYGLRLN